MKNLLTGTSLRLTAAAALLAGTLAAGLANMPSLAGGDGEGDVMDNWADFSTLDGLFALLMAVAVVLRRRWQERHPRFEDRRPGRTLKAGPGVTAR